VIVPLAAWDATPQEQSLPALTQAVPAPVTVQLLTTLMPVICTGAEVITVETVTPLLSKKVNALGVLMGATGVTLFDAADAEPGPALLVAVTVKV
jgi:hypothetical protein